MQSFDSLMISFVLLLQSFWLSTLTIFLVQSLEPNKTNFCLIYCLLIDKYVKLTPLSISYEILIIYCLVRSIFRLK